MISIVDADALLNVLRPTIYRPSDERATRSAAPPSETEAPVKAPDAQSYGSPSQRADRRTPLAR